MTSTALHWKSPGPILNALIIQSLDEYITRRLPGDPNVIVSVSCRNPHIQGMFPGDWPRHRIAKSLGRYMNMRSDQWVIAYNGKSSRYDISRKPGDESYRRLEALA